MYEAGKRRGRQGVLARQKRGEKISLYSGEFHCTVVGIEDRKRVQKQEGLNNVNSMIIGVVWCRLKCVLRV